MIALSLSVRLGLASVACVALAACDPAKDKAQANPDPAPSQAAPASSASSSSSAAAALTPPAPPLLELAEQFPGADGYSGVYAVEGALLVSSKSRWGKVGDAGIEWEKAFGRSEAFGDVLVMDVSGTYPDGIDVQTMMSNGRAPMPSYVPSTGKGTSVTFSPGGGMGWVAGIARVGESTLVAGYDSIGSGHQILHVRGPKIVRTHATLKEGGCATDDLPADAPNNVALDTILFGATRAGTVLAFGDLCKKTPAAEVWAPGSTKSKIVKEGGVRSWGNEFIRGPGDVAWVAHPEEKQILEYRDGKFSSLPALPSNKNAHRAFADEARVLHATDGSTIYRFEGGAWKTAATLVWSSDLRHLVVRDGTYWATSSGKLVKLVPGKSLAYTDGCKTPFVQLYDVSDKAEPTYKFPTTTKALGTFAEIEKVGLVEYYEQRRRLGMTVPSKEVGEAVMAHVKANMKDEEPRLLCYEPKTPRAIPVTKAK